MTGPYLTTVLEEAEHVAEAMDISLLSKGGRYEVHPRLEICIKSMSSTSREQSIQGDCHGI